MVRVGTLCLVMALGACTLGPDYKRPLDDVPARFAGDTAGITPVTTTQPWWLAFHDSVLTQIIDHARASSPTVQQALAAVREARASVDEAQNGLLPTLNGQASVQRSRQFQPPNIYTPAYSYGSVGFDASWELDLWGKTRRAVEAAKANAEGAQASADDAMLTLLGDVARNYAALRGTQAQLAAVQVSVSNEAHNVNLVQIKQRIGDGTMLEVVQAQTDLDQSKAEIPTLEAQIGVAIHALSILCNEAPDALTATLIQPAPVPTSDLPQTSVPADLIRRRPDVRQAERLLAANTAQVGTAIAGRYPSLSLSGSVSFQSTSITNPILTPLFAIGPSVNIPILDGKLDAPVNVAKARMDEARYAYRSAVLKALQDVEDAMTNLRGEQQRHAKLANALATAKRGVVVAHQAFYFGATDFLTILTAQRALDQISVSLAQSNANIMTDEVALFKALGGGYAAPNTVHE